MGRDLVDALPLRQAGHVDLVIEVTDVGDERRGVRNGVGHSHTHGSDASKPLPEDSRSVRSSEAATAAHRVQFGPEYFIGAAD
jgi:hypothetical protein